MRTFNLPARNVPFKRTAEMGMDETIAVGPKTSIITHTKTHVVPEQTAHEEVSQLAINIESKETWVESQCNVEQPLVKCDQKVYTVVKLKIKGEDGQCNVEIPLVQMGLKDHNIVGMSVVPENTDYACMLANNTTFEVTW